MSLPGGPATAAGTTYQDEWFISFLLDLLHGSVDEVLLEVPGVDWAEGYTALAGNKTWYQMKLRSSTQSGTIASIKDVLKGFKEGVEQGNRCKYVSMEGMQKLDGLTTRARKATDLSQYLQKFVHKDEWKKDFETVRDNVWGVTSDEAFKYLKLIYVRTVDFDSRRQWNLESASIVLEGNPLRAVAALGDIVKGMIHVPMKLGELESILKGEHHIHRKRSSFWQKWRGAAKDKTFEIKKKFILIEKFSTTVALPDYDLTNWENAVESSQGVRHEYAEMIGKINDIAEALDGEEVEVCKLRCDDALTELNALKLATDHRALEATAHFTNLQSPVDWVRQREIDKRAPRVSAFPSDADVESAVKASDEYKRYRAADAQLEWAIHEQDLLDAMVDSIKEVRSIINRR